MELEFKNGTTMDVDKVMSAVVNALFVRQGREYFLVNRHALMSGTRYAVEEITEDE